MAQSQVRRLRDSRVAMKPSAHSTLLQQLNQLFHDLQIPISIESPWELTPSLILAALESILRKRLPVPQALRQSRDLEAKAKMMEIFLERTADHTEDGLSWHDVDPQRLALGEWDEVVYVGEVLCWLGRSRGYLADSIVRRPLWRRNDASGTFDFGGLSLAESPRYDLNLPSSLSPSRSLRSMPTSRVEKPDLLPDSVVQKPRSTAALSVVSQVHPRRSGDSPSSHRARIDAGSPSVTSLSSRPHTPRCIHEVEKPGSSHRPATISQVDHAGLGAEAGSPIWSECPSGIFHPLGRNSARRTDWIEPIDIGEELLTFETARRPNAASPPPAAPLSAQLSSAKTPPVAGVPRRITTRHNSPTQHTLALLNERVKLTQVLARLKMPVAR